MARPTKRGVGRQLDPLAEIFQKLLHHDALENSSAYQRRRAKIKEKQRDIDPDTLGRKTN
jgi:hypothetical protein